MENKNMVIAILFQLLILIPVMLFYGRFVWRSLKALEYLKKDGIVLGIFSAVVCITTALFLIIYFSTEQDIKRYDFSVYWLRVIEDKEIINRSVPEYLEHLRNTLSMEYTHLAVFPLILASYLFGVSFTGYVLSIYAIYLIPACLLMTVLVLRLFYKGNQKKPGKLNFIMCFGVTALSPLLLWPMICGYLDIAGVVVMFLLLNYVLEWDGEDFSWKRNLKLAGLSVLLILTRRWYAFYIVGFYAAFGLNSVLKMLISKKWSFRPFLKLAANLLMIAGVSVVAILLINPEIFNRFLGNDYGSAYSAFKTTTGWQDFAAVGRYAGMVITLAAVWGFLLLVTQKSTALISIRMLVSGLIAGVMFCMTQSMGHHHKYLISPTLLLFAATFICLCLQRLSKKQRRLAAAGTFLFLVINCAYAFVPQTATLAEATTPMTTQIRSYPVQDENYDIFKQVTADLSDLTQGKKNSVYIIGDSDVFSPEHLRRVNLPEQVDAAEFVIENATVDSRDGFPSQLFIADYVLVTDPFVTMFDEVQQVSYQIYDMLMNDPMMETYYQLEETYALAEHELLLFKRVKNADRACIENLSQRLKEFYSDTPFVYEPDYFMALLDLGDSQSEYNFWGKEFFISEIGESGRMFSLNDTSDFNHLSFTIESDSTGFILRAENQNGEIYSTELQSGASAYEVDINGSDYVNIYIEEAESGQGVWNGLTLRYDSQSL